MTLRGLFHENYSYPRVRAPPLAWLAEHPGTALQAPAALRHLNSEDGKVDNEVEEEGP